MSRSGPNGGRVSYLPAVLESRSRNAVFYWIDVALQKVRDQQIPYPWSSYCLAMPMVAGFLAANSAAGQSDGTSHTFPGPGLGDIAAGYGSDLAADLTEAPAGADPQAAYGMAFCVVTEHLLECSCRDVLAPFAKRLSASSGVTEGLDWGDVVGRRLLRFRSGDNSEPGLSKYNLGRYRRRPHPAKWEPVRRMESPVPDLASRINAGGIFPGFGKIRLWTTERRMPFRPDFFHNPAGPDFAEDFDLLRSVGGVHSMVRTPEQMQSALFWAGIPGGVTISGHFLLVAILALRDRRLSFLDLARVFALIGMVQCDVTIQAWDAKYHFDIMRPETAIRHKGQAFANSDVRVTVDKDWCSAIPTPEYPSYVSGHSAVAAAVTDILRHVLRSDQVSLSQVAPDAAIWPGGDPPRREWGSLSQIVEDCGNSRIFGGVNWLLDHERAVQSARITARNALSRFLPAQI